MSIHADNVSDSDPHTDSLFKQKADQVEDLIHIALENEQTQQIWALIDAGKIPDDEDLVPIIGLVLSDIKHSDSSTLQLLLDHVKTALFKLEEQQMLLNPTDEIHATLLESRIQALYIAAEKLINAIQAD